MSTPVRITKSDLIEKVEAGWKRDALAEHYGIPVTQMATALKQAGLRIRKFHKPKFELIDDVEIEEIEEASFTEEEMGEIADAGAEAIEESAQDEVIFEQQTEATPSLNGW